MFVMTNVIKGYLIKGAVALTCVGVLWQNYQTIVDKNELIEVHEKTIEQLNKDKEELKKEMLKKGKSEAATEQVKSDLKQTEVKHEKTKSQANQYVEKKLAAIEKKYADMEQNAANAERKRIEISLERAKGLWLTYCLQVPEDHACK